MKGWSLPLEQRCVGRCAVDHAFSLEFYEGEHALILRIAGDFTISDRGRIYQLNPAVTWELGPAISLFGQTVRAAGASADGKLELVFADGRTLLVEPDADYEAWEVSGPYGMQAVCSPGGEISIWQPKHT